MVFFLLVGAHGAARPNCMHPPHYQQSQRQVQSLLHEQELWRECPKMYVMIPYLWEILIDDEEIQSRSHESLFWQSEMLHPSINQSELMEP